MLHSTGLHSSSGPLPLLTLCATPRGMAKIDLDAIERSLRDLECVVGVSIGSWVSGTGRVLVEATTKLFAESRSDRFLVYDAEADIIGSHPGVEFEFHCVVEDSQEILDALDPAQPPSDDDFYPPLCDPAPSPSGEPS